MNEYLKQLGSTEFDNFHDFELKIKTCRSTYHSTERKLLEKNICIDANKISSLENGRTDFYLDSVTFQTFIHLGKKPILYVFLNGSLKKNVPEFNRWSYYSVIDGTMINIADPMYTLYPDLKLGWYYGNDELNLRKTTASLVSKIADYLGVSNESIIFFGSSGGGAASFEISYYCPKSIAVAINPQLRLADWGTQGDILENTVGILLENDKWHREDALWYFKQNKQSIYFLIVNLKSEADMKQLERIKKELKININYGLNCYNNLIIWIYEADGSPYVSPHSSQEFHSIFNVIDYLCEQVQNKSINEKTKELVLLINDCWMEQWEKEKEIYEKKVNLSRFLKIRNEKRIITLFGAGNLMQSFDKEYFRIKKDNLFNIGLILDNNADKNGLQYAKDVKILCPAKQNIDWKNLFIIIMVKNDIKEIIAQLEQQGLQYEVDFILYNDIFEK